MTREQKQKIFLLIPLAIISCTIVYTWISFLITGMTPLWRHYLALGLFAIVVYLYFKSFEQAVVATAVYLLLATFNALSLTPQIVTSWFKIGPLETPHFVPLSLLLFILFLILNSDALVNMYLDHKEAKSERTKNNS